MTKSPRKNVPDVGIELRAACMPSELASDRATAPGQYERDYAETIRGMGVTPLALTLFKLVFVWPLISTSVSSIPYCT